ncbi:hypothetical protein CF15_05930 [Pyrodictium occultum]|uniref:Uncharacterized protein n=1 Tax=Pyrodictium occultum TaxID=2309 RepID=A0A0V8RW56_PYROC|nr:hypothetical protein [Pyrodictium occultum]KSW12286.1 hypothetical protein CF15_05930 [Pyrodictium occultum]
MDKPLGLVGEDGSVDYGLALKITAPASRDEYLKRAILSFAVREFRDGLRRMPGLSFSGVTLRWDATSRAS